MKLTERLELFNTFYGIDENPDYFGFMNDPRRIAIRNEALRQGERSMYEKYVREKYPEEADSELEMFDKSRASLRQVSGEEALRFFRDHLIKNVQSDLDPNDPDAIFSADILSDDDVETVAEADQGYVLFNLSPERLADKQQVWLDPSLFITDTD